MLFFRFELLELTSHFYFKNLFAVWKENNIWGLDTITILIFTYFKKNEYSIGFYFWGLLPEMFVSMVMKVSPVSAAHL